MKLPRAEEKEKKTSVCEQCRCRMYKLKAHKRYVQKIVIVTSFFFYGYIEGACK